MKKQFVTIVDKSAEPLERMIFSAGKVGYQVEMRPEDLKKVIRVQMADITVSSL